MPVETLHSQTSGQGPALVLLHGWGMHSGIWQGLLPELEKSFTVTRIDLPGHGGSAGKAFGEFEAVVDQLAALVPDQALWVGWSLGALFALGVARRYPQQAAAVCAIAGSPRFTTASDWAAATDAAVFEDFEQRLAADARTTWEGFLALQVRGSAGAKQILTDIREALARYPLPDAAALQAGLAVLSGVDLRAELKAIECPVAMIFGDRDRLVPPDCAAQMQSLLPQVQTRIIERAGHAPFVSHPREVLQTLELLAA